MIEIPEAIVLSEQINNAIKGKVIQNVEANHSPHKFAWFNGDSQKYHEFLSGKKIIKTDAFGSHVEIHAEDARIVFSEGVCLTYTESGEKIPKKHQLLIEFDDFSSLCASVQMYGGLCCFLDGEYDNKYYLMAKEKPSPLHKEFDEKYFKNIISVENIQKKSIKAFLATEQRIPGLGNGVLHDILLNANLHHKRKVNALSNEEKENLYRSIKSTLLDMVANGGRDTEKDIYGCSGGYKTKLSRLTNGKPCLECGTEITKASYMGGSIYFCSECQKI